MLSLNQSAWSMNRSVNRSGRRTTTSSRHARYSPFMTLGIWETIDHSMTAGSASSGSLQKWACRRARVCKISARSSAGGRAWAVVIRALGTYSSTRAYRRWEARISFRACRPMNRTTASGNPSTNRSRRFLEAVDGPGSRMAWISRGTRIGTRWARRS